MLGKKTISLLLSLALVIPMVTPQASEAAVPAQLSHINIVHTNDMHGFFVEGSSDGMGAAKVQTVIDLVKAANPNTLVLDAGDAVQGNPLVTLNKGENGIKVLNALKYDAMAIGNHEFDYGAAKLTELKSKANFPMLAANIKTADGKLFAKDNIIKTVDGVKIGIFGISTPETLYKSHPDNTKGLIFEDPLKVAKEQVAALKKQGAQVIICLAHLGDEGDLTSAYVANGEPGIDVIIDGHSHSTYPAGVKANGVLIASTGEKTKNVGIIDLTVLNGKIKTKRAGLFTKAESAAIKGHADVAALVTDLNKANEAILSEVVATSPVELVGERAKARTGETNLGNLITAAFMDISKADISLINGGGIRASIKAGAVTKKDIITVLPFGNTVRVIEVTGADIKAALENGIDTYPVEKGAFPHIAGMTVTFDAKQPAGKRVVSIKVGDQNLDPAKTYKMVTNDFLAAGGDGYTMFKGKKVVAEYGAMDEVLIQYMNTKGFDAAKTTGRIQEINTKTSSLFFKLAS